MVRASTVGGRAAGPADRIVYGPEHPGHLCDRLQPAFPHRRRTSVTTGNPCRGRVSESRARSARSPGGAGATRLLVGQVGGCDRGRRAPVVAPVAVPPDVT